MTENQLAQIEVLADTIWREHYIPIIGKAQVDYMLTTFQSVESMQAQINAGYSYYIVEKNQTPVGYFSVEKREEALFLSKLYVLQSYRGQGIGRASMDYITQQARATACSKITLTVNRYNQNTIRTYEAFGFKNVGEQVADIGNGFVMDDYLFEKTI